MSGNIGANPLCELHIKQGSYELAAFLACNLKE
ncbi:Hok/Gef family protein [Escherichia coli]|nr:Hok/Gef family protein [Escherichia coli]WHF68590.1 Hok/Gef family protein [Escherichia coli]